MVVASGPDLNGDGYPDIAATNYSNGTVSVLLGNSTGHFSQASGSPIQVGQGVVPIATAVFGNDNHEDIVVGNQTTDSFTILVGDGNGIFTQGPQISLPSGCAPAGFATSDYNGDTLTDLAVAESCVTNTGNTGQVQVFLGDSSSTAGNPVFKSDSPTPIALPAGPGCGGRAYPDAIAQGTFDAGNSDTHMDLAVLDGGANQVDVLKGDASGGFTVTAHQYATGTEPACSSGIVFFGALSLVEGNFGGPYPDLAVGFQSDGKAEVMLADGKLGFSAGTATQIAPGNTSLSYLAAGNFTSSPRQGLAASGYWQGGGIGSYSLADWIAVAVPNASGTLVPVPGSPYELNGVAGPVVSGAFGGSSGFDDVGFLDGESYQCKYYGIQTLLNHGAAGGTPPAANLFSADGCRIPQPSVTTGKATGVSLNGATLTGSILPAQGTTVTSCRFEYGIGNYNSTVPCKLTQPGNQEGPEATAALGHLAAMSAYQFQLVVTAGGSTVTGGRQTFTTCDALSVPASALPTDSKKLEVAGCFTKAARNTWVSTGDVKVNGIEFSPAGGSTVTVDASAPALRVDGPGVAKLGGVIPFYPWAHSVNVPLSGTITLFNSNNFKPKVYGFPISGSLTAKFSANEADLTGTASLDVLEGLPKAEATLTMITDNESGIAGAGIALRGPAEAAGHNSLDPCEPGEEAPTGFTCSYPVASESGVGYALLPTQPNIIHIGPLAVQDFELSYDGAKHEWSGGGAVSIEDFLPEDATGIKGVLSKAVPTLGFTITVGTQPLQLDGFSVSDQELSWTIGPVTISDLSVRLQFHPSFGVGGSAGLMTEGGWKIDGGFDYQLGDQSGFSLKLNGDVSLSDVATVGGSLLFDDRDGGFKVAASGSYSRSFGPASASLSVSGGLAKTSNGWNWELDGNGSAGVFGWNVSANGVLSNAGVGACGQVPIVGDVGFKHFWSGETDFDGCDFSGIQTVGVGGARDAAAARSITVSPGQAREEFAVVGSTGPPQVTLTGPGGQSLATPAAADRMTLTKEGMALAVTSSRTTYFIVPHPQAGRWMITASPSSPVAVRYEYATPLLPVKLTAHVNGSGHKRTLRWHFQAQRGVGVEFLQAGGTEERILQTTRGSGSRRFAAAPGLGGARTVIAVVSIDGFPRERLTIAHFTAPKPSLPRVSHATYRVRNGKLTVHWSRLRSAAYYDIGIRLSTSVVTYRVNGRRDGASFRLGRAQRVRGVAVTVSIGGIEGTTVHARNTAPRRPHRHRR